jgi:pre-mRNA-splicing factor 38A
MANRTDKRAHTIKGTDPQNLLEKLLRLRIWESRYWKEHCFALTAATILPKVLDIRGVGSTFGPAHKPCPFMCLVLKLLQIQPPKEIVAEYILSDEIHVRLLGAFYMRLVGKPVEVYRYLEPLLNDYRRVHMLDASGVYTISHVDEIVDQLLNKDAVFDITLPFLPKRWMMEEKDELEPRVSLLEEMGLLEAMEKQADEAATATAKQKQEEEEQQRHQGKSSRSKYRRRRSSSSSRRRRKRRRRSRSRSSSSSSSGGSSSSSSSNSSSSSSSGSSSGSDSGSDRHSSRGRSHLPRGRSRHSRSHHRSRTRSRSRGRSS